MLSCCSVSVAEELWVWYNRDERGKFLFHFFSQWTQCCFVSSISRRCSVHRPLCAPPVCAVEPAASLAWIPKIIGRNRLLFFAEVLVVDEKTFFFLSLSLFRNEKLKCHRTAPSSLFTVHPNIKTAALKVCILQESLKKIVIFNCWLYLYRNKNCLWCPVFCTVLCTCKWSFLNLATKTPTAYKNHLKKKKVFIETYASLPWLSWLFGWVGVNVAVLCLHHSRFTGSHFLRASSETFFCVYREQWAVWSSPFV